MSVTAAPAPARGPARAVRAVVAAAATPAGWLVAVVVLAVALAVGSVHSAPPTKAQRITALESVLKCPSCIDLSVLQSDTAAAANLRSEVVRLVDEGRTDAQIKAIAVAQYGSSELLSPPASGIDSLAWAVPLAVLGGGAVVLAAFLLRRRRRGAGTAEAGPSEDDEALVRLALGRGGGREADQ